MAIIGNPIISTDFPKDTFSGNGSTTAFTMSIAPASVNAVIVVVSGITQDPSTYTISGTTLTFSAAPPTGTDNISVRHLGVAGIPNVPATGSVVPASINSSYALWNLSGSDVNYTAGNVGIGTNSPSSKLHLSGTTTADARLTFTQTTAGLSSQIQQGSTGFALSALGSQPLLLETNGTERMRIDSSGSVGIGTASPTSKLTVAGDIQVTSTNYLNFTNTVQQTYVRAPSSNILAFGTNSTERMRIDASGYLKCVGVYTQAAAGSANVIVDSSGNIYRSTSALKYKTDVRDLESIDVNLFRPVRYKSNCQLDDPTKDHFGVIADEVDAAGITELVSYGVDGEIEGFQYERLTVVLLKAIQELNDKVEAQALEIQALKGTV